MNTELKEVFSFYLSQKSHRSKVRDYCSLNRLYPYFENKAIADIKRLDVRGYVQYRKSKGIKEATIKRELRFACAAVNYYRIEQEKELANPFKSLGLKDSPDRIRWITQEQAARLIAESSRYARSPHLSSFIKLALNTGCRKTELLGLEWERVDLNRRQFRLEALHTKSAKRRTVPLNNHSIHALEIQREFCKNSPFVFPSASGQGHIGSIKTGFKNACQRAGIQDFRIHDLRHTCASWLVMKGVDLYTVRDLLGHSSITQTERYAHLSPEKIAAAVQLLE